MNTGHALNIGIIGAARVAVYAMIAPAKDNPRTHVFAIAARNPVRGHAFAAVHGIAKVHATYAALMADPDIDLVYIATPPAFHAENAIAALRAGKHVLVEKPFAMNAVQAAEMVAAAGSAGRRVFEAFHYRHHALWQRITDIVRGGQLGALKAIEAAFHVPIENTPGEFRWDARLGGGALMDLGCYPLQWARVVAGEEPVVTSARMRIVAGVDAETQAELRFPSGLPARISCGMDGESFKAFVNVEGSLGRMSVMNPLAPQMGHLLETRIDGVVRKETVDGPATFAAQLEAVVAALLDGAPFALADDDPIKSMALIDAVRAAAQSA
ncbi:MAG: Gfo/Idh/MocA family oxidoreductase [Alphaproteobacteria bacterium]|nr:Gfo/Idh/MocA family oxidoreductase [Alphaproteobacteria bacterium]